MPVIPDHAHFKQEGNEGPIISNTGEQDRQTRPAVKLTRPMTAQCDVVEPL